MRTERTALVLKPVCGDAESIEVEYEASGVPLDGGVVVFVGGQRRVVVENHQGKLVCHVWGTLESIQNDPTDSVLVERGKE